MTAPLAFSRGPRCAWASQPGPFVGQPHKRLEAPRLLRGEATFIMRYAVAPRSW